MTKITKGLVLVTPLLALRYKNSGPVMTTFSADVVQKQLRNGGLIPGYLGYKPTSYALAQYGKTFAAQNEQTAQELKKPQEHYRHVEVKRSFSEPTLNDSPPKTCKQKVDGNYWVPPIPGYLGYIPTKYAENAMGGCPTKICRIASDNIQSHKDHCRKAKESEGQGTSTRGVEESTRKPFDWAAYNRRPIVRYAGYLPQRSETLFSHTFTRRGNYAAEMPTFDNGSL